MKLKNRETSPEKIPWEGRDELNLAEFPIAVLASRPNRNLKTVHFEDRTWDKGRKCFVPRRLTISASDQYGLPTALDDELVLGLIQLTREEDFHSRKVFFSRYRLLKILGWRTEGKNYARLETSLKRWLGVTFYYQNAWWDKTTRAWVDENFHLLDQVSLYGRQRRPSPSGSGEPSLSMFVWNEVVFHSFQAGYLKQIDLALFRRLKSPIAKRLYRLLDKRFYHKPAWEFDLRELACEHVGLSRGYDVGQLKRKLRPAIAELVEAGYLKPLEEETRFFKQREGQWQVVLSQAKVRPLTNRENDSSVSTTRLLVGRGVHPATARELVRNFSPDEIRRRVAILDWLAKDSRQPSPKNPAGYLVQSLRENYALPPGFWDVDAGVASEREGAGRPPSDFPVTPRQKMSKENVSDSMDRFIRSLSSATRERYEKRALKSADPRLLAAYRKAVDESSSLMADLYRRLILERYLADRLMKKQAAK